MADPSGEVAVDPEVIVNDRSSDNCATCVDEFEAAFESSESAQSYDLDYIGETSASRTISDSAETPPTLTESMMSADPKYQGALLKVVSTTPTADYQNVLFCTSIEDPYTPDSTDQLTQLTGRQVMLGLDQSNDFVGDAQAKNTTYS